MERAIHMDPSLPLTNCVTRGKSFNPSRLWYKIWGGDNGFYNNVKGRVSDEMDVKVSSPVLGTSFSVHYPRKFLAKLKHISKDWILAKGFEEGEIDSNFGRISW